MAQRLTMFSKLLITILIVGAIVCGAWYFLNNTSVGSDLKDQAEAETTSTSSEKKSPFSFGKKSDDDVIKIGVVTWGGYAGGQYFNEGFEASEESRFYKDCLLYTSPSPRDQRGSRMPSSA